MEWKDKYPQKIKPAYGELLEFFRPDVRELFLSFDGELRSRFNVQNKYQRFLPSSGWAYGYGRSYNCELLTVTVAADRFTAAGVSVHNSATLQNAIDAAQKLYDAGFEDRYAEMSRIKRENQAERAKRRTAAEKVQLAKLTANADPDKLNKFKWCRKVSRSDLIKLYQSEASGLLDEALLEKIGISFFIRCKQSKDIYPLLEEGKMICHFCGNVLQAASYTAVNKCVCGYCYTYREYRRSFNANNMPAHRAQPVFDAYIEKWQACMSEKEKMLLVDWLIHECHVTVMSGERGRSVCVNLIEGTAAQLRETLEMLAGH